MNQELIDKVFTKLLETVKEPKTARKIEPTRIRINGKFVEFSSGKSIWERPGDAKLALRNEIEGLFYYEPGLKRIPHEEREEIIQEIYRRVEFVKIELDGVEN